MKMYRVRNNGVIFTGYEFSISELILDILEEVQEIYKSVVIEKEYIDIKFNGYGESLDMTIIPYNRDIKCMDFIIILWNSDKPVAKRICSENNLSGIYTGSRLDWLINIVSYELLSIGYTNIRYYKLKNSIT